MKNALVSSTTKSQPISQCEFELLVCSKHDDTTTDAFGPTLSIALSHTLPELRYLAHSRAVFGARLLPESGRRTYGCWELEFLEEDDRPRSTGYEQFGVRCSVEFHDELEAFDALSEFDDAEDSLRYCAQKLGEDEEAVKRISAVVQEYLCAAYAAMLWDPKSNIDLAESLDELSDGLDWSPFVSTAELEPKPVIISDVEFVSKLADDEWLVKFRYVNGADQDYELEFADLKKNRIKIRRDAYSALRSPNPAFRGDQLPQVYDALQTAIDQIWAAAQTEPLLTA